MKEIFPNFTARFLIYLSLALLSMTTLYGTFFVVSMYQTLNHDKAVIQNLEKRMAEREAIAAKYVPLLESVLRITDQQSDLLHRIMDRQKEMNRLIEKPLVKKKR